MKSKATTYVLIVVVLAVWGMIIRKMFFSGPAPGMPEPRRRSAVVCDSVPDTLRLDYRDPFLGSVLPGKKERSVVPRVVRPLPKPPASPEKITMRYLGRVGRTGQAMALVEQGELQHTLRPGDELDGFRLSGVWPDSVRFVKGEHTYTVKLSL